jgi:hypothetical protein
LAHGFTSSGTGSIPSFDLYHSFILSSGLPHSNHWYSFSWTSDKRRRIRRILIVLDPFWVIALFSYKERSHSIPWYLKSFRDPPFIPFIPWRRSHSLLLTVPSNSFNCPHPRDYKSDALLCYVHW